MVRSIQVRAASGRAATSLTARQISTRVQQVSHFMTTILLAFMLLTVLLCMSDLFSLLALYYQVTMVKNVPLVYPVVVIKRFLLISLYLQNEVLHARKCEHRQGPRIIY